ncbi:TrkA C-terminal domain-containing protein [Streptomyces sp. NPDC006356]
MRSKYGVTVVGIKRPGEDFTYATAETVVEKCDVIVVTGKDARGGGVRRAQLNRGIRTSVVGGGDYSVARRPPTALRSSPAQFSPLAERHCQ